VKNKFVIRELKADSDYAGLAVLLSKYFPLYSASRMNWFYIDQKNKPYTCLAFDKKEKRLVGSGSIYKKKFLFNKNQKCIGQAVDFAIDEELRVFGPAVQIQRCLIQEVERGGEVDVLLATPGKHAHGVFRRVGYQSLGNVLQLRKVIKVAPYMVNRFVSNKHVSNILSRMLDRCLLTYQSLMLKVVTRGIWLDHKDRFDEKFDKLWNKCKSNNLIIGDRSSNLLNWRNSRCTGINYKIITFIRHGEDDLVGYIVYTIEESCAKIMDLLVDKANKNLKQIMPLFIKKMREQGLSTISMNMLECNPLLALLEKEDFKINTTDLSVLIYSSQGLTNSETDFLHNPCNWYLLDNDLDL
jgi:hypothetical protein